MASTTTRLKGCWAWCWAWCWNWNVLWLWKRCAFMHIPESRRGFGFVVLRELRTWWWLDATSFFPRNSTRPFASIITASH
ncbi:hypothetical protein N431DRAFT_434020 [Stipitochalara longipes BDJ]|nr:hypothetical protein N431DRAFT_434020 [Stipitochalara longipes BDJ]